MTDLINKFYKGFSTRNYEEGGGNLTIYNLECVTQDLLNEIFTVKGERINMPNFGTRIPLLTFELNDLYAADVAREDIEQVIDNDPRVKLVELQVLPQTLTYKMTVLVSINYLEFNVTKDLRIEITSAN